MSTLIAIAVLGVIVLLAEIFNLRKAIIPVTLAGLIATLGLTVSEFGVTESHFNNMIKVNNFTVTFSSLFIVLTIFLVALSANFYQDRLSKISDFISIKLFLLAGAVAMVSFGNLAMFFLGIEVLSIALYILAGSDRLNVKSNESGMKYFLMGSFASGIILFGIALIYGAVGSFDMDMIYEASNSATTVDWFYIGVSDDYGGDVVQNRNRSVPLLGSGRLRRCTNPDNRYHEYASQGNCYGHVLQTEHGDEREYEIRIRIGDCNCGDCFDDRGEHYGLTPE